MMRLSPPTGIAEFMERVRCLCAIYDGSITSWGRTEARNRQVGGARTSKHQWKYGGMAVDVILTSMETDNRADFVRDARSVGLWVLDETDHIHVQGMAPGE
jgi:hypothetical protein